jgi:hypothetical protein
MSHVSTLSESIYSADSLSIDFIEVGCEKLCSYTLLASSLMSNDSATSTLLPSAREAHP